MKRRATKSGRVLTTLFFVCFAATPLYIMYAVAVSLEGAIYKGNSYLFPGLDQLTSFTRILAEDVPILSWLVNSALVALGTTLLSLTLAVMAGYAISRYRFHGRGAVGFGLFATQMLPEAMIIVPLYALFVQLALVNRLEGLILANTAFAMPVAVWIIKGAMDKIPYELEEAARVDGCPPGGILAQIVLPLVAPSVAAAAVVMFFDGWNEFLFASTFIHDESLWPASKGLASFVGQYSTPLPTVFSGAIIFALPAILFFVLVQRRIIGGLTAGAVKG